PGAVRGGGRRPARGGRRGGGGFAGVGGGARARRGPGARGGPPPPATKLPAREEDMIDIVTEINATRRAVEAGRGGADDVYAVRLRRCYDAPALLGFGRYLSGHEPDEARSWSQSAQAREFMTRSSPAWGAAHDAPGATAP